MSISKILLNGTVSELKDTTARATADSALSTANAAIPSAQKGAASGVAELDSAGKVPSSQLPSYVDDVIEVSTYSELPAEGETGKIYITLDDNKTYRWSGSTYVPVGSSLALGETESTAYRGDRGKTAYDHSQDGTVHVTAQQKTDWDAKLGPSTFTGQGDLITSTAASTPVVLAKGASGQVLSVGSDGNLIWKDESGGGGGTCVAYEVNLPAASWAVTAVGGVNAYTQVVSVVGLSSTVNYIMASALPTTLTSKDNIDAYNDALGIVKNGFAASNAGQATFTVYELPAIDVKIYLLGTPVEEPSITPSEYTNLTTRMAAVESATTTLSGRVTTAESNITTLDSTVSGHTTSIGTNTTNIATNTSNIATNTSDISTLQSTKEDNIKYGTVSLLTASWTAVTGQTDVYQQTISITGLTTTSKVDLQPDYAVLNQMSEDGTTALYVGNDDGTAYAFAVGSYPTVDLTVQYTLTAVTANS